MHDPMTQAFQICLWYRIGKLGNKPWRYWVPIVTVWHVDPEKDGSDDSCGWSYPRCTKEQSDRLKTLAQDEAHDPWFQKEKGKRHHSPTEMETLARQAILLTARVLRVNVTLEQATLWAVEMLNCSYDNIRGDFSFLAGWHSNNPNDTEDSRQYHAEGLFFTCARIILRNKRRWYQHPKYHFWHWKLQMHPLQAFKRWAFSRCQKCGGRFAWGYCPVSTSWDGGPKWFRSERYIEHSDCGNPQRAA